MYPHLWEMIICLSQGCHYIWWVIWIMIFRYLYKPSCVHFPTTWVSVTILPSLSTCNKDISKGYIIFTLKIQWWQSAECSMYVWRKYSVYAPLIFMEDQKNKNVLGFLQSWVPFLKFDSCIYQFVWNLGHMHTMHILLGQQMHFIVWFINNPKVQRNVPSYPFFHFYLMLALKL